MVILNSVKDLKIFVSLLQNNLWSMCFKTSSISGRILLHNHLVMGLFILKILNYYFLLIVHYCLLCLDLISAGHIYLEINLFYLHLLVKWSLSFKNVLINLLNSSIFQCFLSHLCF